MRRRKRILLTVIVLLALAALVRAATVTPRPDRPATAAPYPLVWAHQGASGYAPENTLESYRLAVQQGADVLDTDLAITKDRVILLSHDLTVDRLTNGKGQIADLTLAEVKALDAGYNFKAPADGTLWRGRGVKLPTLDEFLGEFAPIDGGRLKFSMEIKTADPALAQQLWAAIQQYHIEDRVVVHSFIQDAMNEFRRVSGGRVATSGAKNEMYVMAAAWKTGLGFLWQPKMDAFAIPTKSGPFETDRASLARFAHGKGIKLVYWTIDDPAQMKHLLEIGADGLITNFPDRAVKVRAEMGLKK